MAPGAKLPIRRAGGNDRASGDGSGPRPGLAFLRLLHSTFLAGNRRRDGEPFTQVAPDRGGPSMKPVYFLIAALPLLAVTTAGSRSRDDAPPPGAPFRFRDVTDEAGLAKYVRGALNHAVAWGDFDNDGRL